MDGKYKVIEIYKMDFGCEERVEGMEDIVEGSEVSLTDGKLKKYSEICGTIYRVGKPAKGEGQKCY